jgi:hypothetical protein
MTLEQEAEEYANKPEEYCYDCEGKTTVIDEEV